MSIGACMVLKNETAILKAPAALDSRDSLRSSARSSSSLACGACFVRVRRERRPLSSPPLRYHVLPSRLRCSLTPSGRSFRSSSLAGRAINGLTRAPSGDQLCDGQPVIRRGGTERGRVLGRTPAKKGPQDAVRGPWFERAEPFRHHERRLWRLSNDNEPRESRTWGLPGSFRPLIRSFRSFLNSARAPSQFPGSTRQSTMDGCEPLASIKSRCPQLPSNRRPCTNTT